MAMWLMCLSIQSEIAERISNQLGAKLSPAGTKRACQKTHPGQWPHSKTISEPEL